MKLLVLVAGLLVSGLMPGVAMAQTRGEVLFRNAGCAACHSVEELGAGLASPGRASAPDLSRFVGVQGEDRDNLARYLTGVGTEGGPAHPFPLALSPAVADTLAAWLGGGSSGATGAGESGEPGHAGRAGTAAVGTGSPDPLAWPGTVPEERGWLTPAVGAALLALAVVLLLLVRPAPLLASGGMALGGLLLLVLPGTAFVLGAAHHLERSRSTEFCLACHVMEPYGKSLVDPASGSLAAAHFQSRTIPREEACYACHTRYTMYGDLVAKATGVRHLYVNYLGTIPDPLELYEPYQNRECLHCHTGARSYEGVGVHQRMAEAIESDARSCLSCHAPAHAPASPDPEPPA